ncbi:MAG: ParA family protein [Dehalococcoidales bacterium]|nr:ParA family protein [Dehalococcoidales bacterium]
MVNRKGWSYTLAIANPKGGVGKTTTTINLGAALAEKQHRVLLIDFDPQGHLTAGCGLKGLYLRSDFPLADLVLRGDTDQIKAFITPVENFWVMPAHMSLIRLEDELVVQRAGETRLKKVLEALNADFEFCLIDSPPAVNILADSVLLAAGRVLVPVQAEDTSIRGIEALEAEIQELKDVLDANIEIVAIVPNMVTSNSVSERVLGDLRGNQLGQTGRLLTEYQIRKRIDLAKAWHEGKSIFNYNPRCDAIESYRKLADFVCQVSSS